MIVILDTNVFISYLLTPGEQRTITQVMEICFTVDVELLVPLELLEELTTTVQSSPYLHERIPDDAVEQLVALLKTIAIIPNSIEQELPAYVRDPDDDDLLAYGLVYGANYLVSGDPDLLVLEHVGEMRTVSPRAFLEILE
jgi:hypothetical protein